MTPGKALFNLMIPAAVLATAWLLVPYAPELPASLSGLRLYGPWATLALAAILALSFRRGRVVLALLMLALAYACHAWLLRNGISGFRARTVFVALCVFVPFNFALLSLVAERGFFNRHGAQRLGLIAIEAAFAWWLVLEAQTDWIAWAYAPLFDTRPSTSVLIPQLGLCALVVGVMVSAGAWLIRRSPLDLGFTGALIAFGIAMSGIVVADRFSVFIAAGALLLTVALLQDTFRMAFRDELTGLPSRRDLNERMMGLGNHYTIAMLDVDHFKKFNDTYGHDLGDQVLKMVAHKIDGVSGGGTAYRYGGEEFTVLFPGKSLAHALPHLEALRGEIAKYKLSLRASDRPAKAKNGARRRGTYRQAPSVSVTISIGVAERGEKAVTPEDVIKAADKALYRAKHKGRNQVSR